MNKITKKQKEKIKSDFNIEILTIKYACHTQEWNYERGEFVEIGPKATIWFKFNGIIGKQFLYKADRGFYYPFKKRYLRLKEGIWGN